MATITVLRRGVFYCARFRHVFDCERLRFVDRWGIVPTVCTAEYSETCLFPLNRPLRAILHTGMCIDLSVLCDLVERLTGLLVMAHKVDPQGRAPHGSILPRSWFMRLIHPGMNLDRDESSILAFGSAVIDLVRRIGMQLQRDPVVPVREQFTMAGGRLTGPLYIARM